MTPVSKKSFKDWQTEQPRIPILSLRKTNRNPATRLPACASSRGLTQPNLAEMVRTRQPSIARLENGSSVPSLPFWIASPKRWTHGSSCTSFHVEIYQRCKCQGLRSVSSSPVYCKRILTRSRLQDRERRPVETASGLSPPSIRDLPGGCGC